MCRDSTQNFINLSSAPPSPSPSGILRSNESNVRPQANILNKQLTFRKIIFTEELEKYDKVSLTNQSK